MSMVTIPEIQLRLRAIFESEDGILAGQMAARVVFVALYGSFVDGLSRYFRPDTIVQFSDEQAALTDDAERAAWFATCLKPKAMILGTPWYAKGTREPIRDDLIRNKLVPFGAVVKLEGLATTSPKPIFALSKPFAALFNASLEGDELAAAIKAWRAKHLDPMALKRHHLLAQGLRARVGDIEVALPQGGFTLKLGAGEAAVITRDVCEVLAPLLCGKPVVVHVSTSEKKIFPELLSVAEGLGLKLNASLELPDVVFADLAGDAMRVFFVEVVHSDGVVHALRAKSLLKIALDSGIPLDYVMLVTAFEDRSSPLFRKRFKEIAVDSSVWFRTEPTLIVDLASLDPDS